MEGQERKDSATREQRHRAGRRAIRNASACEAPRRGRQIRGGRRRVEALEGPFGAHEEEAGLVVLMLIGKQNVGAVAVEEAGDGGDETFPVGSVDEEGGGVLHAETTA
jgi:hypothetical protein